MKKKLLRFLCTALMAVVCMSVNAQATSGSCGYPNEGDVTWEYDSGTLTISGTGEMADYTDALTDNPWNAYRTSITKVVIGNSITHIGNWAFMGCSALTEVTIGDHVTSIGAEAFANCLNEDFKYLAIPASVEDIGAFALSNIKYLEYIACYASTAPTLGAEALTILNNLVAIYVPTAKVANYQAATGWSDLSAKITYPHGNCGDGEPATDAVTWAFDMASSTMTLIGTGAIKNFGYPGSYPWTNAVATGTFNPNGTGAYDYYWAGIQSLVIGEGITVIPDWSFAMQINLASISLPSTLKTIGESSLEEGAYTSITLPEGLETIGAYAFNDSKFSEITIPSTVTSIGASAFNNCTSLQTVTMFRNEPPTLGDKAFFNGDTEILPSLTAINVPAANVEDYKAATNWSDYVALIVAGGEAPATTTTFTYTASEKVTAFDTYANFTGATGVSSHEFADGAGTVVYEGTVTAIADGMMGTSYYSKNTTLTGVVIPSGVKTVGIGAFSYCSNLASVTLPDDLVTLDQGSFAYTKIAAITIPDQVESINAAAFMGCAQLAAIDIPNSVTFLGNNIFLGCSKLASATLGSGITAISRKLFDNCVKLESIVIPDGVTTIGAEAFMGCTGLTTVTIGSGVTEIEDGSTNGYDEAFRDCSAVTDVYCYANPATLTWDKNSNTTIFKSGKATLFHVADADAWITKFPDANVTFVGDLYPTTTFIYTASEKLTIFDDESKFTGATGVKSHEFAAGTGTVVYDGTVTAIEDYTFRYDSDAKEKMTGITIPESVTNTGEYTFWMCKNLATVTFAGTPTLTTIGKSAFKGCEALTTIAIPASVEEIGVSAFSDCTKLANVTFSGTSSLTTINQSAFSGCTSLTSITLPESLTTLGTIQDLGGGDVYYNGSVFYGSGITSLNIPKNVTNIYGAGYFGECDMTSLTVDAENAKYADLGSNAIFEKAANKLVVGCNASSVPAGVTTIGYESFWAISDPFTLTLPASVTTIEARAFHLANGLLAINIPSGVTEIGEGTFAGCSITTLALPDALTTIGREAFNGCPELTTLTLGSELTTIGEGAFSGCDKLTSLNIPAKVTTLENAFSSGNLATITVAAGNTKYDSRGDCNAIIDSETNTLLLGCKNTTFPADVAAIGNGAFSGCKGLTSLVIPNTVTSIGSSAFSFCSNLTDISIPNTVTSIESNTFQSCKSLTTLVIHNDMTSIGSSAFSGCSGLTTVTLGSGLTSIGQRAFSDCTAVTDVYCYANPEELTWTSAGLYFGYDFKADKATLCHVADASAWPCTSSSDKFYKVNVTFVGDLAPAVAGNAVDGVYWATYYNSAANMKADANTTVYMAAINGNSLTLTEIADKVINAGEAVILKSTGASIAMTASAAASAADYSDNALEGVDVATAVDASYKYYVLSNENSTLGFYTYTGATLGANKAFIKVAVGSPAPAFYAFDFGGQTTDLSEKVRVNSEKFATAPVYNLNGQRVNQPTKGLYIVNGKKVIVK